MTTSQCVRFMNSRGLALAGYLHGSAGPVMAITCHGMLSTMKGPKHIYLAEQLAAAGVGTLRFDFAGRGESEGSLFDLSYSNEMQDLRAAIDYLASLGAGRVMVFGSSMGGSVAILWAARDERVLAVATLAAVGHPDLVEERHPQACHQWRTEGSIEIENEGRIGKGFLEDALQHNAVSAARILAAPILVLHGSEDQVVPPSDGHDIATAARRASLKMIHGADHRFSNPLQMRPAMKDVARFFLEHRESFLSPGQQSE